MISRLQAKNLSISNELRVHASSGGVLIEDLTPSSVDSRVSIHMNSGSVDLTTSASPKITVETYSDAVCLVGKMNSVMSATSAAATSLTAGTVAAEGNMTMNMTHSYIHKAVTLCTNSECAQPEWNIFAGSPSSSVGVHVHGEESSDGLDILSGKAFKVCVWGERWLGEGGSLCLCMRDQVH